MKVEPTTVQPITSLYQGPNGIPYSGMMSLTASTTTLSATTTDRKTLSFSPALSNALKRGDFIRLSGAYDGYYLPVLSGTTSTCILAVDLPENLNSGTQIYPVRPVPLTVGSGGTTSINVAEWGGTATSLGQKAMAASVPVTIASNQTQVNVAIEATPLVQQDIATSFNYGMPALGYDWNYGVYGTIPLGQYGTTVLCEMSGGTLDSYIYAVRDDVATATVGEGSVGSLRLTEYRALHSNLRDASGNEIASATSTPSGSERGIITRNIPSGTQTVAESTTTLANVARGKIAGTLLTSSYANLLVMGGAAKALHVYNSTDQTVLVSLDGGTTDSIELDPGESYVIDYYANGLTAASATIQAKHGGTGPSIGSVRAMIAR